MLWGSKYKDKDYFIRLHLLYGANTGALTRLHDPSFRTLRITNTSMPPLHADCDHWHEGAGFVGSHMALTLEYEQALQAVNPVLSVPYWDFTLEATFYNEVCTDPCECMHYAASLIHTLYVRPTVC